DLDVLEDLIGHRRGRGGRLPRRQAGAQPAHDAQGEEARDRVPAVHTLYLLRGVGATRAEERLHVALLHDGLQRAAALDDFAAKPFEDHAIARLEVVRTPALPPDG